jgi:hypothetical protein
VGAAIEGALASRVAVRQAFVDQHRWCLLAANELDGAPLPPQERPAGDTGQGHAERGFRFLKDPRVLASSRSLKKPARIMALWLVRTVCLLVYATVESRMRQALTDLGRTLPHQQGTPVQNPTARWVLYSFGGHPCASYPWAMAFRPESDRGASDSDGHTQGSLQPRAAVPDARRADPPPARSWRYVRWRDQDKAVHAAALSSIGLNLLKDTNRRTSDAPGGNPPEVR